MSHSVVIVGAGPAGLTGAYWLSSRYGILASVHEASETVGGISQTVNREGWRFDIGGHRFFTKVDLVNSLWTEILEGDDFLTRQRLSRIYYKGKFFDYPLKPLNALLGLGIFETVACIASYLYVKIRRPSKEVQENFEGWVASRFGWRLYRTFFKTYTEKVWGIPAQNIRADWAAQRIKDLNLFKAIFNAFSKKKSTVTSLIEEFQYPKYGPGQMWEKCADKVVSFGCKLTLNSEAIGLSRTENGLIEIQFSDDTSEISDFVLSTMPINGLIEMISHPAPPSNILKAARNLKHRDFLTVALVVPKDFGFPDNWIYIHSPEVRLGRIQNFASWSPDMVPDQSMTCLGLEYFVNEGDDLWEMSDESLIEYAKKEISLIQLVPSDQVIKGYVVRMPKAYPVYDQDYLTSLSKIRDWLKAELPNVIPIGRNGMHRYNNQDHSMMTAVLAAENVAVGSTHNLWEVNVESEYHESYTLGGKSGRVAPMPIA